MSSVVLDPQILERLRQAGGRVEIRSPAGQTVGYFTPCAAPTAGGSPSGSPEVPFTDEELDRFEKEPGGRPLAEILRDLEARS